LHDGFQEKQRRAADFRIFSRRATKLSGKRGVPAPGKVMYWMFVKWPSASLVERNRKRSYDKRGDGDFPSRCAAFESSVIRRPSPEPRSVFFERVARNVEAQMAYSLV